MPSVWDKYYLPAQEELLPGQNGEPSVGLEENKLASQARGLPDNLELNDEFLGAFQAMERTQDCLFITGKAGTGKSTLLKYFKAHTCKNVAVLAPTGVAAINIGGQTIHSFFKFPPRLLQPENIRKRRNRKLLRELDTLIIDEVSMVRADLMDGIDYALRLNRGEMGLPFGGLQVIFFGDLFQLPPVVEDQVKKILAEQYESPYFFHARAFNKIKPRCIELNKVYRQTDSGFIGLLNRVRNKEYTRCDLDTLNRQVRKHLPEAHSGCIILTATNYQANLINESRLKRLDGEEYEYSASVNKDFEEKIYPTESRLKLKVGAQVILLKNDPEKRWVNGTIAEVSALRDDQIRVRIGDSVYEVPRTRWEKINYEYNSAENKIEEKVAGTFEQYPLKLAWAITIHKSQGQTFDKVLIDLGYGAFTHGQVYVGLSRCSSLQGIILKRPITESDIIFDERIYGFKRRWII